VTDFYQIFELENAQVGENILCNPTRASFERLCSFQVIFNAISPPTP